MIPKIQSWCNAWWKREETTLAGWWMIGAAGGIHFILQLSALWPQIAGSLTTLGLSENFVAKTGAVLLIAGAFLVTPRTRK